MWLLIEVSDTVFPRLGLPEWTVTFVIALLLLGVPVALFFAWAYELTPEGLKREQDVDRNPLKSMVGPPGIPGAAMRRRAACSSRAARLPGSP